MSKDEWQREYCHRMAKVITRYLTASELEAFGAHLETFATQVTERRPAQGLHDASYSLKLRFRMGAGPEGEAR